MKASFQVIRDSAVIFEAFFEELTPQNLPRSTAVAIEKFGMDHPTLKLTADDIVMRWAESEGTSEES